MLPALDGSTHQSGMLQHPDVFRYGDKRHGVVSRELGHGCPTRPEPLEQSSTDRVRYRGIHVIELAAAMFNQLVYLKRAAGPGQQSVHPARG